MKQLAGIALVAAAFTAGCGDDVNTAQVDSFIQSLAEQSCAWEFRCCKDPEIQSLDGRRFTDQNGCVPYRALALQDQLYIDRLAVKEGRLRVDQGRASSCISQMTTKVCNPGPGTTPPVVDPMTMDDCAKVFVGATPIGAECIYANECVDGAHCVQDMLAVGRGVCVPFQEENQICNDDTDCDPRVPNLYCAKQDFKCHIRSPLGGPCAYTTDTTGLNPSQPLLLECDTTQSNLYCDPTSRTCKLLPQAGTPCLDPLPPGVTSECDPNPTLMLICDRTTTGGTSGGICRAPGKLGDDCSTIQCGQDLFCDRSLGTPTCAALPSLGQSCSTSNGECKKPYFCNFNKNPAVCDQPAQLGQDCSQVGCDLNLYCDRSNFQMPVCRAQLPDGALCTSSEQCLSLICNGAPAVCQPQATGVQCTGR